MLKSGVAEPVIGGPLVRVAKHLIGFVAFLETVLAFPVARIAVRMMLHGERLKVPHMGWSPVRQARPHPLWAGIDDGSRFYFAHSFYPEPADAGLTVGTADYPAPFTCAIARANIFATQFHPEKRHRAGQQLLANFVNWDGRA